MYMCGRGYILDSTLVLASMRERQASVLVPPIFILVIRIAEEGDVRA